MKAVKRVLVPEILDQLDADDPRAVRSREDLRLVNRFMRGEAWILSELAKMKDVRRVVDLGAGKGCLGAAITRRMPSVEVVCVDLIPRPRGLDDKVSWWQGDLFDYRCYDGQTVVVANLFLHHLAAGELRKLGHLIRESRGVLSSEPYRAKAGMLLGRCLFPFVNDVTRHDMMVSIRAGFRQGELGDSLGCDFSWSEQRGWCGAIRVKGMAK